MTSVPKPLKFMIPHFDKMKQIQGKMSPGPVKVENLDVFRVVLIFKDDVI